MKPVIEYQDLGLTNQEDDYYRVLAIEDYSKNPEKPIHREYYFNKDNEIFKNVRYKTKYGTPRTRLSKLKKLPELNDKMDLYTTISGFTDFERKEKTIGQIYDLVIDLDAIECDAQGHEIKSHTKLDLEFAANKLLPLLNEKVFAISMPIPTCIVHTGRGLQFHYQLDNETDTLKFERVNIALRERLAEAIREGVEHLGTMFFISNYLKVDTHALAKANGLFRARNTFNTKSKSQVQDLENTGITYKLDDIIKTYELKLDQPSTTKPAKKKKTAPNKASNKKNPADEREPTSKNEPPPGPLPELPPPNKKSREISGTRPNNLKRNNYTITTLINDTLRDLEHLQKMRNRQGITSGYRYTILSIYSSYQKRICHSSYEKYKKCCLSFNNWFNEPLPEDEAITYITAIWDERTKDNPEDIDLEGNTDNIVQIANYPTYRQWSTKKIIQRLGITEDEQIELCVLISSKEKDIRKKNKNPELFLEQKRESSKKHYDNKEDVMQKRKAKAGRNAQILDLHKQGMSLQKIADKVGCSKTTVYNVIKKSA